MQKTKLKITDEQVIEMIDKIKSYHLSITEAASFYGISKSYVTKLASGELRKDIKRPIISKGSYARKVTIPKAKRIIELRREGMFHTDIAEAVGLSLGSVRLVLNGTRYPELNRDGIKIAHHKSGRKWNYERIPKELAKIICQKVADGQKQSAVADEYNLSRCYVNKIVHGRVFEDVFIPGKHYTNMPPRKSNKPKSNWRNRSKGMTYNEYGMLVPIKS